MKYNIFFKVRGPAGTDLIPNKHNPIESDCINDVLAQLAESLPLKEWHRGSIPENAIRVGIIGIEIRQYNGI